MKYRTIVADPPWAQKGGPLRGGVGIGWQMNNVTSSRDLPYPTMTVDAIAALPVESFAQDDAHLYLWTTNRYLREAFDVARAWGFAYSTTLVWAKNPMGGGLGGAFGISTEFCLFARRGSLPALSRVKGTWFPWKRVYGPPVSKGQKRQAMHSVKPPEFFDTVMQVSPGPYLEMFARTRRMGWDAWGNEVESDLEMAA